MTSVPRALGFRMPAEWEPHHSTWLSWPHKQESWPGKFDPIPPLFAEIVQALCPYEWVDINVNDEATASAVRALLQSRRIPLGRIRLHIHPTNDAWCRDHGPIFLVRERSTSKEGAVVDWGFNAWGNKYPPYDLDNQIPGRISALLDLPRFVPGMVLEGGSIDVNGRGTLLTTESCLLNRNRNPQLNRQEIESMLRDFLGVTKVLWLGEGIAGDDTDGHVDDLARFVDERTVLAMVEEDPQDVNYKPLQDNLVRLKGMRDEAGRPLEIVTLPLPRPKYQGSERLPCSYANFYVANGTVLVPTYDAERDRAALELFSKIFPSRKIVGIECTDLVWGLGALHCVTQQQPELSG